MSESSKKRSIDFLTEDQLQRKREADRKSKSLARERTKAQLQTLELQVAQLQHQNQELERRLAQCTCHAFVPPAIASDANLAGNIGWGAGPLSSGFQGFAEHEGPDRARVMSVLHEMIRPLAEESSLRPDSSPELDSELTAGDGIWVNLPEHTQPTCALDHVVIQLIENRRRYEPLGGNDQEFLERPFPSVQSLLNPTDESERQKNPVTSSIVTNIIRVMTVPSLPEQVAILYFMGSLIRWLVSPTQENYFSMPEWLRPTRLQLLHSHPAWMDLFIWPKARDRLCSDQKYFNQNALMAEVCNASFSVNWPYQLADMIMPSDGISAELVLMPRFESHIRDLRNWSLGPQFLEVFPDFLGEVNIRPTQINHAWT